MLYVLRSMVHILRNRKTVLVFIFIFSLWAIAFNYPDGFNKAADFINKTLALDKQELLFDIPPIQHINPRPFKLGLDLQGGAHLVYEADTSQIKNISASEAVIAARDVIERRVDLIGVSEPNVQIAGSGNNWRIIVELAGVKNLSEAIDQIGATPFLDFREPCGEEEFIKQKEEFLKSGKDNIKQRLQISEEKDFDNRVNDFVKAICFQPTGLNGRHLVKSELQFDQGGFNAVVGLNFNDEGKKLFAELTKKYVCLDTDRSKCQVIAIFLDQEMISAPTVQQEITTGQAVITGNFSLIEAKKLVQRLNAGALPVPIKLISQETIGASLGQESLNLSLYAGIVGALLVILFMILYYRLPGILASIALIIYILITLSLYKVIPVTLTLSGIAGLILSIGMAVDANILIFERMKEEIKKGLQLRVAAQEGFKRAWPAIRDSNITTLISTFILFTFGTSFVKGFALTLGMGVLISMFTAITVTRLMLYGVVNTRVSKFLWLFNCGFNFIKIQKSTLVFNSNREKIKI